MHWRRLEYVFTVVCPAMRTKRWRHCLRAILLLIRMFTVTIMGTGILTEKGIIVGTDSITEKGITVGKISMVVRGNR